MTATLTTLGRLGCTLAAVATLLTGCASMPRAAGTWDDDRNVVAVENRTIDDLVIYLVRDEVPIRLATIPGFSTRTLNLPPALVGSGLGVRLAARALGSNVYLSSDGFSTFPGEGYTWVIGASEASTYLIRR